MANTELIHCNDIAIKVTRSQRRKTMALQVRNGQVTVRIPAILPMDYVQSFVEKKQSWIKQRLSEQPALVERNFKNGESLLFLGQPLFLEFVQAEHCDVFVQQNKLIVKLKSFDSTPSRKKQLLSWLKKQAEHYCQQRVAILSERTGLKPSSLKVRSYSARWGSCSIAGELKLNWKLIMAPAEIIDYVIIHELCHLKHHNHSAAFWQLVDHFDPNRKLNRDWLKRYGHQLNL